MKDNRIVSTLPNYDKDKRFRRMGPFKKSVEFEGRFRVQSRNNFGAWVDVTPRMSRAQTNAWLAANGYQVQCEGGAEMIGLQYFDLSTPAPKPLDTTNIFDILLGHGRF